MDPHRSKALAFWSTSAAAAVATKSAVAGQCHVATHISGSSDAAAVVTLESPDGTVLWRKRFAAAFTFSETLPPGEYTAGVNQDLRLEISAGTNREINLAGYSIRG